MKTHTPYPELQFETPPNLPKWGGVERNRDSIGRFASELQECKSRIKRLENQLKVQRVNYAIWQRNKENKIQELINKLNKYDNSNRF